MADDFVPSDPEFTVKIIGPDGPEWINMWKKSGENGEWWSGKDKRDQYVNINRFVKKEDRESNKQQPAKW